MCLSWNPKSGKYLDSGKDWSQEQEGSESFLALFATTSSIHGRFLRLSTLAHLVLSLHWEGRLDSQLLVSHAAVLFYWVRWSDTSLLWPFGAQVHFWRLERGSYEQTLKKLCPIISNWNALKHVAGVLLFLCLYV